MRADETSWPYNNPAAMSRTGRPVTATPAGPPTATARTGPPATTAGLPTATGRTGVRRGQLPINANSNGQDWPYGEDHPSYPANGNGQDWTAGDDSWPVNGNGPGWPYGEDHPSWPAGGNSQDWPRAGGGPAAPRREPTAQCITTPACRWHRRRPRHRCHASGSRPAASRTAHSCGPVRRARRARRGRRITRSLTVRAGCRFSSPPPTRTTRPMSGQAPGRCPSSRRKPGRAARPGPAGRRGFPGC